VSAGLHTVHVRVNDAATGKPVPCRIRFTDAQGTYLAPLGRLTHFLLGRGGTDIGGNLFSGDREYAYIDGTCEIALPAGPVLVEASRGFEYTPLSERVALGPAKLALRLGIQRWADLRQEGWYSGDTWAHEMTPHAALLEAAAEDLSVVNLLAREIAIRTTDGVQLPAISNILAFSGQRPALEMPGHLVVVNTLNDHDLLGRLALLNCHRAVYPLSFGGTEGVDNWSLADWCDQCHRKGGLVVGHDFFGDPEKCPHGEMLADLILGKVDALEMTGGFKHPDNPRLREWYALLSCGFRVPLVGGSEKTMNAIALGERRTYARLQPGQEFNYKNWIEAVRAGRTFVTNGPLLSFTVNDQDPGSVLKLSSPVPPLRVRASARSLATFNRLEVLANGEVIAQAEAQGSPWSAALEVEVPATGPGWLAARCLGAYDEALWDWIGAHSSPVYVQIEGQPLRAMAAMIAPFVAALDGMLDWVAHKARCETDRQREHLAAIFRDARQALIRLQAG
jgi:hypothetical protein